MAKRAPTEIGWREWVALPDLGVSSIQAKVDTGADSSSLHAFNQERFQRDGVEYIRFEIHPGKRTKRGALQCESELVMDRKVRNPGGRSELRPVISTPVVLNGVTIRALINLTERDEMSFRMLIGRRTMRGRFLVNPGRSYLGAKPEIKNQK
ncbi:MAG TPA: RimK/LysX family protein [Acidimicrobiia bacterium]